MLNWEQTNKLHEIAMDSTLSPERRKSDIVEFMRIWGEQTHYRGAYATNHALFGPDDIDPGKASTNARMPIPGQLGRTVHPGYYER